MSSIFGGLIFDFEVLTPRGLAHSFMYFKSGATSGGAAT